MIFTNIRNTSLTEIFSPTLSSICSGSQYWVFKDTVAMDGYPRPLSDWGMRRKSGKLVDRVDAAFIWAHNGKTYLFSNGEFWRFDESNKDDQQTRHPEPDYPRDNSLWAGVPSHMDDVISWGQGKVVFIGINKYTDRYILDTIARQRQP